MCLNFLLATSDLIMNEHKCYSLDLVQVTFSILKIRTNTDRVYFCDDGDDSTRAVLKCYFKSWAKCWHLCITSHIKLF